MYSGQSDEQKSITVFVNGLCLVGALIGLCSIYLPWVGAEYWSVSLADILNLHSSEAALAGALFLAGTFLALLFPIGGVVQLAGLFMFCRAERWFGDVSVDPAFGFFVALASCALVLAGFVRPMGPGYASVQSWWSERAETSAKVCLLYGRVLSQRISSIGALVRAVRTHSVWMASLFVAISAVICLACAGALGLMIGGDEREYVHTSLTGVIVEFNNVTSMPNLPWSDATLRLDDGVNTVGWDDNPILWASVEDTSLSLEERNLSGLTVFPIITDSDRDGSLSGYDQIEFVAAAGESFSEGCSYSVLISRPAWALDIPTVTLQINFTLHSEDEIESDARLYSVGGLYAPPVAESEGWTISLAVVSLLFGSVALVYYGSVVETRRIVRKRRRFD